MSEAVDDVLALKYGPVTGIYADTRYFGEVLKPEFAGPFIDEVPHVSPEIVAVVKAVCEYVWATYGRFPAHVDAIYVPELWVQAHHLDLDYYDRFYQHGYSETQARHDARWHVSP
jgi:hypothetical protein